MLIFDEHLETSTQHHSHVKKACPTLCLKEFWIIIFYQHKTKGFVQFEVLKIIYVDFAHLAKLKDFTVTNNEVCENTYAQWNKMIILWQRLLNWLEFLDKQTKGAFCYE